MTNKSMDVVTGVDEAEGLVPKLRFPEFRDAGSWAIKPLSALAKRQSKRNSDHSIVRVLTNSAEYGVVDQKDFFEKDIAVQGNLDTYFIVQHGDYVYNPRISILAPVGPIGKNNVGTGVMSPLYTVFRFSADDDRFYEHYFRSTYWHGYLRHASNSGARHDRMAISNEAFMAMSLPAPSTLEQQKIADCLSSLDTLIAAVGKRLAALKNHKKGLMQQLFPRPERTEDGITHPPEPTPRIRFPEFRDAGKWTEQRLSDKVELISGLHLSPDEYDDVGDLPYFSGPADFTDNVADVGKWTNKRGNAALAGDIVIVVKGSGVGDFWRLALPSAAIGRQLMAIRAPAETSGFLYHALSRTASHLKSRASGNLIPGLARPDILEMKVAFPPTHEEQETISKCLTEVDTLIDDTCDKIETLKAHKSGLMQQLFLAPLEANA